MTGRSTKLKTKPVNHQARQSKQNKTKQDHAESFTPISACAGRRRWPNKDEDLRPNRMVFDGESLSIDMEIALAVHHIININKSIIISENTKAFKSTKNVMMRIKLTVDAKVQFNDNYDSHHTWKYCVMTLNMITRQVHNSYEDLIKDNEYHHRS